MKAWFRRNGDEARDAWEDRQYPERAPDMLVEMTHAVTHRNAFGWYRKAGVL
jgi:hypothetical protein